MTPKPAPIGILLVTHGNMGQGLIDTVTSMLGKPSLPTDAVAVHSNDPPEGLLERTQRAANALDHGTGVVILTDAFGSTPSNIANQVAGAPNRTVIAGVNLPMLIRIYNYPTLALDAMVASAVEAGRTGVMPCSRKDNNNA